MGSLVDGSSGAPGWISLIPLGCGHSSYVVKEKKKNFICFGFCE